MHVREMGNGGNVSALDYIDCNISHLGAGMPGKFDDIPTEPMFDAEEYREGKTKRPKTIKSVAQGKCPLCTRPKLGAIRLGQHLAWRTHSYTTWGGKQIDCVASGVYVCVLPETVPLDPSAPLRCRHS